MKDKQNKKIVIIVIAIIIILLICLFSIRSCNKDDSKTKDKEINEKTNSDKDNDTLDDVDSDVVATTLEVTTSKPNIWLNGSDLVYVEVNSTYKDEGASAFDQKYGDLTDKIIVSNPVDISQIGTYIISYTVINDDHEVASVTRTVIVVDTTKPTIEYKEGVEEGQIIQIDASKYDSFMDHAVVGLDNSNDVRLEMTYFYKQNMEDEYTPTTDVDLSKIGYYKVHYIAVDGSNNKSNELVVEYHVQDTKGPVITVSMNGTIYPMLNPTVTVNVEDEYTDVSKIEYAWVTDLTKVEEIDSWQEISDNNVLSLPGDGTYYLIINAEDALGNKSHFESEAFEKDSTLVETTKFMLNSNENYKGIDAGIKINKLENVTDVSMIMAKLYSNDMLLATNINTNNIYNLSLNNNSLELTTSFIVTNNNYQDNYWTNIYNSEYNLTNIPTKVVFEVYKTNGAVYTVEANTLDETTAYWESFFYDFDLLVGQDRGNYNNLTEALSAVGEEGTIMLLPGTYDSPIEITKNVTIFGLNRENTIITTTTNPVTRELDNYYGQNPVIYVNNGELKLSGVTVSGNVGVNIPIDGITVNNGNLNLDNVIITNIRSNTGYTGAQYGRGITAYGTSTININNCHINNFNKNGAHFIGTGVNATITNTTFIGAGKTAGAAQNGVVFMDGANGRVDNNNFINFQYYDSEAAQSYGILKYNNDSGNVQIGNNNFIDCDGNYN